MSSSILITGHKHNVKANMVGIFTESKGESKLPMGKESWRSYFSFNPCHNYKMWRQKCYRALHRFGREKRDQQRPKF